MGPSDRRSVVRTRPRRVIVGESSSAAGARFVAVLHDAMAGYPGGHVVLVTHGGVTVDGLRSLVGDRALSEACPEWTAACRRAG